MQIDGQIPKQDERVKPFLIKRFVKKSLFNEAMFGTKLHPNFSKLSEDGREVRNIKICQNFCMSYLGISGREGAGVLKFVHCFAVFFSYSLPLLSTK